MKKVILLAATTSMLFAGADIVGVDYDIVDEVQAEVVVQPAPKPVIRPVPVVRPAPVVRPVVPVVPKAKKWYVGLDGMGANFDTSSGNCNGLAAIVGKIGYDFTKYFGIEGRAGYGVIDADHKGGTSDIKENYGIYLKPMLPLGDKSHLFGLLGYAKAKVESTGSAGLTGTLDESSPSFGLGLNYAINDRWSVVGEGVRLLHSVENTYNKVGGGTQFEDDINLDTFGLGLNYKF